MRRRLRAACEQPAKARSGRVVRIMMQGIHIAHRVRKSSGIARIERKHCGKALVRIGRDHFCFPKPGTAFRWALLGFPAPPLSGWGPGSLHDAITAGIDGQRNGGFALHLPSTLGGPLWGAKGEDVN